MIKPFEPKLIKCPYCSVKVYKVVVDGIKVYATLHNFRHLCKFWGNTYYFNPHDCKVSRDFTGDFVEKEFIKKLRKRS